jgi:hypothetical protein
MSTQFQIESEGQIVSKEVNFSDGEANNPLKKMDHPAHSTDSINRISMSEMMAEELGVAGELMYRDLGVIGNHLKQKAAKIEDSINSYSNEMRNLALKLVFISIIIRIEQQHILLTISKVIIWM